MRRLLALVVVLLAAAAQSQSGKDDDLAGAFGPQPAPKVFEPEHNVPPPPLTEAPNAELRAGFEKDFAAAQKTFDKGDLAAAREQLTLPEVTSMGLGGPEQVRVQRLKRAIATRLKDPKAIKEADERWLGACGPNEVAACRSAALEGIAVYDGPRAEKIRAADACLTSAEKAPGKRPPACLDAAFALYQKAGDPLMTARIELVRALVLASDPRQSQAARKALAKLATSVDDRSALVRRTALETQSRLELAAGDAEAAVKTAIGAAEAWALALPPDRRPWARLPAVDAACAAYEKAKGAGACRKLEKRLFGEYLFHDFSDERLVEGQLISHEKLVAVNEHYGVGIQNCLAAEVRALDERKAIAYRVKWLVINDGRVDNFHSDSTDQEQSRFVQCLREQFGYWRYPRHVGDPQRIEQSFSVKSSTRTWEESEQ